MQQKNILRKLQKSLRMRMMRKWTKITMTVRNKKNGQRDITKEVLT